MAPVYTAVVLAGVGFAGMLALNSGSDGGSAFAAQSGAEQPLLSPSSSPIKTLTAEQPASGNTSSKHAQTSQLSKSSAQSAHLVGSSTPESLVPSSSGSSYSAASSLAYHSSTSLGSGATTVVAAGITPLPTINPSPAPAASTGAHSVKGSGTSTAQPTSKPTRKPA
jgi:hypothetical protein